MNTYRVVFTNDKGQVFGLKEGIKFSREIYRNLDFIGLFNLDLLSFIQACTLTPDCLNTSCISISNMDIVDCYVEGIEFQTVESANIKHCRIRNCKLNEHNIYNSSIFKSEIRISYNKVSNCTIKDSTIYVNNLSNLTDNKFTNCIFHIEGNYTNERLSHVIDMNRNQVFKNHE